MPKNTRFQRKNHPSRANSPPESGGARGGLKKRKDIRPFRPLLTSPDSGEELSAADSPPKLGGARGGLNKRNRHTAVQTPPSLP